MICNIRRPAWIAICLSFVNLLVCVAADIAKPDSEAVAVITREQSMNQATVELLNARLKLEDWKLGGLEKLRENGFATWLEVSRQQLVVDALAKQRDATQQFTDFTHGLRQRALLASETLSRDDYNSRYRMIPPIKISLPGSVRLTAWIENGENFSTSPLSPEQSVLSKAKYADEFKAAADNLARAEKRYSGMSASGSASEHWKQIAELQLALAHAELQLVQLKQNDFGAGQDRSDSLTAQPFDPNAFFVASKNIISLSAESNRNLALATLRVAHAEAKATGELRAAEFALQRLELRLQALQKLQSDGFAERVEAELDAARQEIDEAVQQIEQLRKQHANLDQSYRSLTASMEQSNSVDSSRNKQSFYNTDSVDSLDLPGAETWPLSLLTDKEFVRHLIDIRCEYYETVARRDALALKLAMLARCSERLESIAERSHGETTPRQYSAEANDFKAALTQGQSGEIESLKLDIAYESAMLQAARERLRILVLEENRFMQQCIAQRNVPNQGGRKSVANNFVSLNFADCVVTQNIQSAFSGCSYFETRDFDTTESALVSWRIADRDNCMPTSYPYGIRPLQHGSTIYYRPSTQVGISSSPSSFSFSFPTSVNRLSTYPAYNDNRSLKPVEKQTQSRLPSYERAYPFGILRADLRSQQPVGFLPWYLPGSPANYPYPNR